MGATLAHAIALINGNIFKQKNLQSIPKAQQPVSTSTNNMPTKTQPNTGPTAALAYSLSTIKKAIMICMALDIPCVMWGGVGTGKSSLVRQIAKEMNHKLYDLRLSDKEPTDLGGIPFPRETEGGQRFIEWLVASNLIPFATEERPDVEGILLIDEIDRAEKQTENVALQLLLDRGVNQHTLCPSVRIVAAGNGISDNGTSVLSDAAATRLVHFYVDTGSLAALDSWQKWAMKNKVSPDLQGFARFRQCQFMGPASNFLETQKPTPRTFTWASLLADYCDKLSWGGDVIEPVVCGAVGMVAGREFLAYRRLFRECPAPNVIAADPITTRVPVELGVLFALGQQLIAVADRDGQPDADLTRRFATYVDRWPEEQKSHFFRTASENLPTIIATPEYVEWERTFRIV